MWNGETMISLTSEHVVGDDEGAVALAPGRVRGQSEQPAPYQGGRQASHDARPDAHVFSFSLGT